MHKVWFLNRLHRDSALTYQYWAAELLNPIDWRLEKAEAIPEAFPVTLPREALGTSPLTLSPSQKVVSANIQRYKSSQYGDFMDYHWPMLLEGADPEVNQRTLIHKFKGVLVMILSVTY